jgi:molybdopterin-guanine dinucleotide biosynthesis protein
MKIKELINFLEKYNPEDIVLVNGYEEGYDEVDHIEQITVLKDERKNNIFWYIGSYKKVSTNKKNGIKGIVLPRKS